VYFWRVGPAEYIDGRAKINTLHWHVVDSQSFPLVLPGYLNISAAGAYDAASVYTPDDVADIVAYAGAVRALNCPDCLRLSWRVAQRGIDVLMEIDTPGHTAVISKAHPEHVACPELTPWSSYANGANPITNNVASD
jgi:hexosaminidase